jgi:hypothetical protein
LALVAATSYGVAKAVTEPPAIPDVYSAAKQDRRGTDQQPFVITKPTEAQRREEVDETAHAKNEREMTLATIVLAAFTVALLFANIWLVRSTKRASAQQALDTQLAIAEAKRSADAMRDVADATKNNALLMSDMLSKQMRAYIQVNFGTSTAQRGEGVNFGSWPEIVNAGLTPAQNVSYRIMADILDAKMMLADDFPEPKEAFTNDATLHPRQAFTLTAAVNRRFDQAEVNTISKGDSRRLFVWGTIIYDDVFGGRNRETKFSHNFLFYDVVSSETGKTEHKVNSYYSRTHNNAT